MTHHLTEQPHFSRVPFCDLSQVDHFLVIVSVLVTGRVSGAIFSVVLHVAFSIPPGRLDVQSWIVLLAKLIRAFGEITLHMIWRKHDWLALEEWL